MRLQSLTIRRMNVLQEFLRLNDFFQVGEEIQMKDKQYVFKLAIKDPDTVLNYCPYCGAKILNDSQLDLFSGDYGDN